MTNSEILQVHWLRIMLEEGHTLGSSLNLTNKFQMATSLTASNRRLLTGTPAPNIPNSQVSHLQPLPKFLHEEAYGQNHKSWEAGILRPFEAETEEICRLPVITPCRHLLCLDCVAMDSEKCVLPGCGNLYEMQSPETLARPENPNPKWPVPKDLIELQPSYKQDDWDPDWHATSSSKVAYLVERLKNIQEANTKMDSSLNEVDVLEPSEKFILPSQNYKTTPEKVIIFSQFLEHIHVIEQQLTGSGIKFAGMYSPMHSSNKMKSLMTFQHDENCMALLMDGSAALGLDLSFVTHVFLMEPIWDGSMEEQVISRAHRMGATRPVNVETLAMRGTIEEQMLKFLKDADGCRQTLKEEFGKSDREGARPHRTLHDFSESNYLAQLGFVRTNSLP